MALFQDWTFFSGAGSVSRKGRRGEAILTSSFSLIGGFRGGAGRRSGAGSRFPPAIEFLLVSGDYLDRVAPRRIDCPQDKSLFGPSMGTSEPTGGVAPIPQEKPPVNSTAGSMDSTWKGSIEPAANETRVIIDTEVNGGIGDSKPQKMALQVN